MILKRREKQRIKIDFTILLCLLFLGVIGIITLLSTTVQPDGSFGSLTIVYRQVLFLIFGMILYFIFSLVDINIFKYWQVILGIYLLTIVSLILVLLIGPVINNVQRWIVIGGIQIQPSEIAKVTVILTTTYIFTFRERYNQWLLLSLSLLVTLPIVLLVYLQPAGSMSVLILLIWFFVAFTGLSNQLRNTIALLVSLLIMFSLFLISISGNWIYILLLFVSIILGVFGYYFRDNWKPIIIGSIIVGLILGSLSVVLYKKVLRDYQRNRIEAFLNPSETSKDIGFNVDQARIAIGSGQIWGKGFGNGTQSKRDFLPEHQTDFIYASFAEEFGLSGTLFLLSLYGILLVKILIISIDNANNSFFSMILVGISIKLLLEIFINIGTNTGIIPATGIPLPLISAGGTITVMTLFSFGLIQSIINRSEGRDSSNIIDNF
ncbi:rod shape-determining protein RodA [Candidatus Dojkabacteria bacterium]|uniref:Rod shape-determining protein RodA n=1 Tax=Candidatus Dojkabacteria bacterium TaxID=2099670 RepID=A0A847VD61_9BACT|nr:rod shape-determining protein RodA [Candidatus Dojkabacteria bacterium]